MNIGMASFKIDMNNYKAQYLQTRFLKSLYSR